MNNLRKRSVIIISTLATIALLGTAAFNALAEDGQSFSLASSEKHYSLESAASEPNALSVKDIVKECRDSIVAITTETVQRVDNSSYGYYSPFGYNPYGYGYGNGYRNNQQPQEYKTQGAASGIVVSADGYIVTNAHVVDSADTVTVTLADGKEYDAQIVGYSEEKDIAV